MPDVQLTRAGGLRKQNKIHNDSPTTVVAEGD
jgi:hypothetical protein